MQITQFIPEMRAYYFRLKYKNTRGGGVCVQIELKIQKNIMIDNDTLWQSSVRYNNNNNYGNTIIYYFTRFNSLLCTTCAHNTGYD